MESEFIFDVVLEAKDICNMKRELQTLENACEEGKRIVLYGMRNSGKTSLVKSLVLPRFQKCNKQAICVFVDLMAVESLEDIAMRLRAAFEHAYVRTFPIKGTVRQVFDGFKTLRPSVNSNAVDGITLSLTTESGGTPTLQMLLSEISFVAKNNKLVLVFDEFQDVARVPQAEAIFRSALQNAPHNLPVIIMGSKKHLLANIFSKPRAPLYNWGEDLEVGPLPYNEYCDYMNERFERFGLLITPEVSRKLQDLLLRNPEAINIVCKGFIEAFCGKKKKIEEKDIHSVVLRVVEKRAKRFEQYLTCFSSSEIKFLIALSKNPGVKHPQGKEFVATLGISGGAVRKAQHHLEDEAVILVQNNQYFLSDPLLAAYLAHTR